MSTADFFVVEPADLDYIERDVIGEHDPMDRLPRKAGCTRPP
jgi:hypothetical protein